MHTNLLGVPVIAHKFVKDSSYCIQIADGRTRGAVVEHPSLSGRTPVELQVGCGIRGCYCARNGIALHVVEGFPCRLGFFRYARVSRPVRVFLMQVKVLLM